MFKYRFRKLQPSAQTAFLVENSLPYQPLPASEFTAVKDKLETIHRVRRAESLFERHRVVGSRAHPTSPMRPTREMPCALIHNHLALACRRRWAPLLGR